MAEERTEHRDSAGVPPEIMVALPAFNEESYIARTILRSRPFADLILVVDDGSGDMTAEIATALGAVVVRHEKNHGYGGALQTIFSEALRRGVSALIILDADGQHEPGEIPRFLGALKKGGDVVIGSRFLDGKNGEIPVYRRVGMKVLDTATNFAGELDVTDTQSGFRGYSRRAIERISIRNDGMSAGSEILVRARELGLTICEVPISVRYDLEDTSSQHPVSHGYEVLSDIISMIIYRRPVLTFGIPGFIIAVVGIALAFVSLHAYEQTGVFPFVITLGAAIGILLGTLLMVSGLMINSLAQILKYTETGRRH
jgi:glycosyltransferase involved in cell wall biosynthesis